MAKIAQAMASEQELIIESKSWVMVQDDAITCEGSSSGSEDGLADETSGRQALIPLITDAIQDAWDELGVPTERLDHLKTLERDVLTPSLTLPAGAALGLAERDSILRAMSMVMQLKGMSLSEWFEACALLDSYCLKVPVRIELLPAICVSIVRIVRKLHTATCEDRSEWLPYTQQLTHWLAFLGYAIPEMTEQFLRRHEMGLLKELGWQVEIPSIEGWIKMATARFN
ncbi:unnamed protein product, partial [Polarella glacialis]